MAYMEDMLHRGVTVVDSSIMALNNAMFLAKRDPVFRLLKYESTDRDVNPYSLIKMRDTFNSLILSHPLIADTGIIFADDVIITRSCIVYYPIQYSFYGLFLYCDDFSFDQWRKLL
jgi:hypothetical protein